MVLEETGYEQISEYINARTKVKMVCPEGHSFGILTKDWRKGVRCGICYREKLKNGVRNKETSNLSQQKLKKRDVNTTNTDIEHLRQEKQEYTPLFKENTRRVKAFVESFKQGSHFKMEKMSTSNGIMKMMLSGLGHNMEIWICKEMVDTPKDVVPIYLGEGDISMDIEYINEWMREIIRNR